MFFLKLQHICAFNNKLIINTKINKTNYHFRISLSRDFVIVFVCFSVIFLSHSIAEGYFIAISQLPFSYSYPLEYMYCMIANTTFLIVNFSFRSFNLYAKRVHFLVLRISFLRDVRVTTKLIKFGFKTERL